MHTNNVLKKTLAQKEHFEASTACSSSKKLQQYPATHNGRRFAFERQQSFPNLQKVAMSGHFPQMSKD